MNISILVWMPLILQALFGIAVVLALGIASRSKSNNRWAKTCIALLIIAFIFSDLAYHDISITCQKNADKVLAKWLSEPHPNTIPKRGER